MAELNSQTGLDMPDDEIGVVRDLRRKKPFNIKSLGIAVFIVVLIVSSFWASFFIGKMLLTPVRKLPDVDFQKLDERFAQETIPLDPMSAGQAVTEESPAVYEVPSAAPAEKELPRKDPFTPEKKTAPKATAAVAKPAPVKRLFKVSSPAFDTREKAAALSAKMSSAGFESFVKQESAGKFSVQAGLFKSRSNAERLVEQLKAKGFGGVITEQ
jgi:hypothetical protein